MKDDTMNRSYLTLFLLFSFADKYHPPKPKGAKEKK